MRLKPEGAAMRTSSCNATPDLARRARLARLSISLCAIAAGTLGLMTATTSAAGESGSPSRREIASIYRGMTRTAASFMQLDRSQARRLPELLADMELAQPVTSTPRSLAYYRNAAANPGRSDTFTAAVAREFGAAAASRWNTWRDLYIGFAPVGEKLREFYNDGVPVNQSQRLKLASTYSDVEIRFPLWPVESSAGDAADAHAAASSAVDGLPVTWPPTDEQQAGFDATATAERDLANSERRAALILKDAAAYLRKDQLASLAARLAWSTEHYRASLQELRDAGSPPDVVYVFRIGGGTAEEQANWMALHRQVFRSQCVNRTRDAGLYLNLEEPRIQRLCDVVTGRYMELLRVDQRRMMDGTFFPPEPYRDSVAQEFGEEFADRWADYTGRSNGFIHVDHILASFYDAGVALTREQRYRLAGCYPRMTVAALFPPANPAIARGDDDRNAWLVRVAEDDLQRSERLNATVLAAARGFLDDRQQRVLERLFDDELELRRESVGRAQQNAVKP